MKYRMSIGWQIFSYVFGGIIVLFGLFMMLRGDSAIRNQTFITVFGLIFSLFGLSLIINTVRTQVEVDEEKVTVTNIFGPRSLLLKDIRGYGTGQKNAFYLIPAGSDKTLDLPPNLAGRDQLISFFTLKYQDVSAIQLEETTSHLLEDERFGNTREERAATLKRTAFIALVVNYLPMVLLILLIFPQRYYEPVMWLVFSIPWIVALITRRMKGLVTLMPKRNNPSPSFFLALFFTATAAFIGTIPNFHFYGPGLREAAIFIVAGALCLWLYSAICGEIFSQAARKQLAYLGFGLLFTVYAAMLILFTNSFYDHAVPRHFEAGIEDKHVSHGKSTTYYLSLSAWGKFPEGEDFSVPLRLYNECGRGDSVRVSLYPGKWSIPWYLFNRSDLPDAGSGNRLLQQ